MKTETYTFNPDEELLTFADEFSKNWEKYSVELYSKESKRKHLPHCYTSNNGKYKIDYFDKIIDEKASIMNGLPVKLNEEHKDYQEIEFKTNIRVGQQTGIIQISKSKLVEYETNSDYLFMMILWCTVEKDIKDAYKSDEIAFRYYLTTGRSIKNVLIGYINLFKASPSDLNVKRIEQLNKLADEHKQKQLKQL